MGGYNIERNPLKDSPRLYSSILKESPTSRWMDGLWGRVHVYNQVSFAGDRAIGINILEIMNVDADDMGTYKVRIDFLKENVIGEAVIELRHRGM